MTHPHDFALLCDLLDGRLAPRAEEDVRRRLEEEPALRAEWDDLRRLRSAVRTLEAPPLPADFASRVRLAAGASDAGSGAASDGAASADAAGGASPVRAASPSPSAAVHEPRAAGRMLSMRRFAFGAAALLVLAFGVGFLLALPSRRPDAGETTETAHRTAADETARVERSLEEAKETGLGELDAAARERPAPAPVLDGMTAGRGYAQPPTGGTGATPRFGPPGAVPPNLRTPSDDPQPHAPAGSPAPVVPVPPPATARAGDLVDRDKAGAPEAPAAKPRSGEAHSFEWAFAGVDDVLVVEAAGLDEGRARVALLLAELRDTGRRNVERANDRLAGAAPSESKNETESTAEKRKTSGDAAGKADGARAEGKDSEGARLDPAWRRLSRASAPKDADEQAAALRRAQDERRAADAAKPQDAKAPAPTPVPGAAAPTTPVPVPLPAPEAPPEGVPAQGEELAATSKRVARDAAPAAETTFGTFILTLSPEEAALLDEVVLPEPAVPAGLASGAKTRGATKREAAERLVRVVVVPTSPAR